MYIVITIFKAQTFMRLSTYIISNAITITITCQLAYETNRLISMDSFLYQMHKHESLDYFLSSFTCLYTFMLSVGICYVFQDFVWASNAIFPFKIGRRSVQTAVYSYGVRWSIL